MVTSTTSATASGGLDVNAIVTGLMSIERQPINKLNTQQSGLQAKISALGMIKSNMASFQTAVQSLGSSSTSSLLAFQATSSDATTLSATTSSTAAAGSYTLNVTSLAQSQKLVAAGQTSATTPIGNGTATTVNFDFGTISGGTLTGGIYSGATFTGNGSATKSITIDSSNNTLQGISDAINAANLGVTASIVNDGSGTPYRLAISSSSTGASNSLKISTTGGDGTINTLLANDPAGLPAAQHLSQTIAAQNAVFDVNGIPMSKSSNTVTDAIQGVTLNLSKITTTAATLTVARDTTAVSSAVSGLVTAYNNLYSSMKNASTYKSGSSLEGDSTLRTLQTQMRTIAGSVVTGGTLSNIGEVGISFKADGTMQLDSTKLASAMNTNFNDVANLFNSTTGFATQFNTFATSALAPDGAFANRTNAVNDSIKNITDRISTLETRMVGIEKRLRTQYSNLNVLLSSMGTTSSYLTQQLSKL